MSRLTAGDICAMAEGDLDKNGKAKGPKYKLGHTELLILHGPQCLQPHWPQYKKQTDLLM